MSYIGNTPGVSSQRVVLEEVVSGSPKSAFVPQSGYIKGYVDVLVNGLEIDATDFTAADGITVTLGTAAAVGDTVKIKAWLPRGLSDGYLKSEADARFLNLAGGSIVGGLIVGTASTTALGRLMVSGGQAGSATASIAALTPGAAQGERSDLALYSTFVGTADNGPRRVADIVAGFTAAWGTEYLGFHVGSGGSANDSKALTLEKMRLDSNGNLSPQGNLILVSGKGIDFSAGSNASGMTSELLDDYEVGTWTPTLGGDSGDPTSVVYTERIGTYHKIGNQVTIYWDVTISSKSGGAGGALLRGLPFVISSSMAGYSVVQHRAASLINGSITNGQLKGYAERGQSHLVAQADYSGTSGFNTASSVGYNASGRWTGMCTYTV